MAAPRPSSDTAGTRTRFDLAGRGIGVTGGGGHLGRALCLGLAEAGATVLACGRREAPLRAVADEARGAGLRGEVHWRRADVERDETFDALLDGLEELAGGVDGFVNNACTNHPEPLESLSAEGVRATLDGVLGSIMRCTMKVAERMQARGRGGSIVNVASIYGRVSPWPGLYVGHERPHNPPAYGAAKAGLIQFTRYAACHLAHSGVRVNSLTPGAFPSPAVMAEPEFVRALEGRIPLARVGSPEDLVGPALFLLSDASSYVTGHDLVVDGGFTAW